MPTLKRNDIPASLRDFFDENPRVALAFSGGCDSSYLLACAKACGAQVKPYLVHSVFQYGFEPDDAARVARFLDVPFETITVDILSEDALVDNPPDRCYHCKRAIFGTIAEKAKAAGYPLLIDGTNATDDPANRPGFRAIAELGVRSPLREAGLTKDEIRSLSRRAGLVTADKPNYSCLATRLPQGERITTEALEALSQQDWLDRT